MSLMTDPMFDEIERLEANIQALNSRIEKLNAVVGAVKSYFTEDLDNGIDMSQKWFKSYNRVKEALKELDQE